jgi:regulator of PEP synthase PpsR (kinase-PPPase family)
LKQASSSSFFHLHLVSDATGETLITVSRAATARYVEARAIEHVYPAVRSDKQMNRVLQEIEQEPGMVLYTFVDEALSDRLEKACKEMGIPCVSVLDPVLQIFRSYLGAPTQKKVGAQHVLNAEYFRRIEALNFCMAHDDGQLPEDIDESDIFLIGISRTSKTPTSIYLANRGYKTANMPLVPNMKLPEKILKSKKALIVGLIATADRIVQIRQNRLLSLNADTKTSDYVDRASVAEEISYTRKLCARENWPLIDVSRKSIEETAASILSLYRDHSHKIALEKQKSGNTK